MPGRIFIVMLVALGALCCPFRCLRHSADSVAFFANTGQHSEQLTPLSPPAQQNESGCICRGAILTDSGNLVVDQQADSQSFAIDFTVASLSEAPLLQIGLPSADDLQGSPPLSGRALRAQLSSFLI